MDGITWIERVDIEIDGDGVLFTCQSRGKTFLNRSSRHTLRMLIEEGQRLLDEAREGEVIRLHG